MSEPPPASGRLGLRIWRGVTLQLFLFAVLPLTVLVLVITFGSLRLHHEAMRSLVADRNLRAVRSAASGLSREMDYRGKTLELLAQTLDWEGDLAGQMAQMAPYLTVFDGGVAVFDSTGVLLARAGEIAIRNLADSSQWGETWWIIQTETVGEAAFLSPQLIGKEGLLPVCVRLENQRFLVGLISIEKLLEDGLAGISGDEPVTIVVIDSDHQVIYQKGDSVSDEDLAVNQAVHHAAAGNEGITYLQTTGGEHVITTGTIQPMGWSLTMEESWEDISSPLLQATQNGPLVIVPILGLTLLAIGFGLRQIVQPVQALEGKANDLARGNFETINQPVGGIPEIRHLQETLIGMAAQVKEAQNSLHSYIGAITESVERERRHLARELHDETLQTLIALGQNTQYALHWNQDEKVSKTLEQMQGLVDQGIENLRNLVQGLRPIYIEDLGLAAALAMQATPGMTIPQNLQVQFHQEGQEERFAPEIEMAFYRIAQEAVNNARRHSGATQIWIRIQFSTDGLELVIQDNGCGFTPPIDPLHLACQGHYGLLGMYERSEVIGARLVVESEPGQGTLIRAFLPRIAIKGAFLGETTYDHG